MTSSVLAPVTHPTSTQIADWIELVILSGQRRFVSARKASELIERSGGVGDETDIALAFGVLHSRAEMGFALYPFTFSRLGIEATDIAPRVPYSTLLIASGVAAGHL